MPIYLGANELFNARLGADSLENVYYGETLVWPDGQQAPTVITQPANTSVQELQVATFTCEFAGKPVPTYQWYQAPSTLLGGETTTTLDFSTTLADNGKQYFCRATNLEGSTDTNTVTLTVTAIPDPPEEVFDDAVMATNPVFYFPMRVNELVAPSFRYRDLVKSSLMSGASWTSVSYDAAQFGLPGTSPKSGFSSQRPYTEAGTALYATNTLQFTFKAPASNLGRASICGGIQTSSSFQGRLVWQDQFANRVAWTTAANNSLNYISSLVTPGADYLIHITQAQNNNVKLYINGAFQGTASAAAAGSAPIDMMLGSSNINVGHMALWNRELSQGEITAIWNGLP